MKVAILQFNPRLGEVEANIKHADSLLARCTANIDLLVLPEMAFSGYNFPSLAAITPYLEPTASGPTTQWAIKTAQERQCHVVVGYPEIATPTPTDPPGTEPRNFNATVTISPQGQVVGTYRKSFLYYTDETWATEGFQSNESHLPFFSAQLPTLGQVGHGICMDINPYRFEAPWTDYEFATSMLKNRCRLVILSMAWLTRLTPEDTEASPESPDMETVAYWLERFWPFVDHQPQEPIVVVFANRGGSEGSGKGFMKMEHGESIEMGDKVAYAGSSCVMQFHEGSVKLWERLDGTKRGDVGLLGKGEEGILVVDTGVPASFLLQQKNAV
ncbi:Putative carbon-nitrogen hydrolase, protein amidase [Septoria linicola]|uniref:Carbon-nitrogen hydrolase, protein amidase n=1 Tax=Septoria linicola TaxID=215465 RepID=A0A9Q9EH10_9PEZI|nr:Putative carbon-nitrogen hydrolase, protein amidase [Septoria linicola]